MWCGQGDVCGGTARPRRRESVPPRRGTLTGDWRVTALGQAAFEASNKRNRAATLDLYAHPHLESPTSQAVSLVIGPGSRARRVSELFSGAAVVTGTLAAIAVGAAAMGAGRGPGFYVPVGAGAIAAQIFPGSRRLVAVATGVLTLAALNPVFGLAFPVLVAALALCRRRALPFFLVLGVGAILAPKLAFSRHYDHPGLWNWINEPSLALAIFAGALWWRARADAKRDGAPALDDLASFLLLFFMPAAAAFPLSLSPRALAKHEAPPAEHALDLPGVTRLLGWFVLKVVALWTLRTGAPHGFLRDVTPEAALRLGRAQLWAVVMGSYLELYLSLAASADIPVLVARLYGWSLPNPFRAALLAWNPVELWRRWGIYNRSLLLQLVYFPLGGSRQHRDRNVLLTFVASALLLHSGWFGSKYATVGVGGWRDETLYFLLQGLAVCACLRVRGAIEAVPPDPRPRPTLARALGISATQVWSAMVHVVVLAQGVDLVTRARLVARCFGL